MQYSAKKIIVCCKQVKYKVEVQKAYHGFHMKCLFLKFLTKVKIEIRYGTHSIIYLMGKMRNLILRYILWQATNFVIFSTYIVVLNVLQKYS